MIRAYPLSIVFLLCLLVSTSRAQVGFLQTLGIASDEPNSSVQIVEYDSDIILSGQYFDQSIGRWTVNVSRFSLDGTFIENITEQQDTIVGGRRNNTVVSDDDNIYFFNIGIGGKDHIIKY